MSKVYVCMAPGLEEVECLAVVDILRRGGVEVETASMGEGLEVTGSHDITVKADSMWSSEACGACDAVFLPGGMPGTANLTAHAELGETLQKFHREGKLLAAICAAPSVLGKYHCLEGKKATCYPGWEDKLLGAEHVEEGVVRDGNVMTGRGLGFAIDEGLELLKILVGEETSERVKKEIQHP
ncbi:DJ-1 family glyoxalase III [Qiania dongpingensis]|uniref:DJ-1/PfpI family protein n=1 Tax=Qiania dongpingensis TaxID=2763669 RepID=A0A7G9G1P7_9FIRM|nr:DJ-1 family glyoxalase III [Qiania dongpingensis]QNM04729.1 DJ-1/PfpI family protein [Qiania dongpingensis]